MKTCVISGELQEVRKAGAAPLCGELGELFCVLADELDNLLSVQLHGGFIGHGSPPAANGTRLLQRGEAFCLVRMRFRSPSRSTTRNLEALSKLAYQPRRPTWQCSNQRILAKPPT